jgi:hypothetical protein
VVASAVSAETVVVVGAGVDVVVDSATVVVVFGDFGGGLSACFPPLVVLVATEATISCSSAPPFRSSPAVPAEGVVVEDSIAAGAVAAVFFAVVVVEGLSSEKNFFNKICQKKIFNKIFEKFLLKICQRFILTNLPKKNIFN